MPSVLIITEVQEGEDGMREGMRKKAVVCREIHRTQSFYRIFSKFPLKQSRRK